MDFKALGLEQPLVDALAAQGIDTPTAIQELAIPKIADNKNIIIQSQTGSGKTLAYLLPLYLRPSLAQPGMQVLILVPTQELAMQVYRQAEELSRACAQTVQAVVLFGDVNIKGQIERLRVKPQLLIGTCGRILELIQKKKITAHTIKTIIIDEADKLLDRQNIDHVKAIRKAVMRDTQVLFASASIAAKTLAQAAELAQAPELVVTADTGKIPQNIQHYYLVTPQREKLEALRKLVTAIRPGRALVFINKPEETEVAATKLNFHALPAAYIHGISAKVQRQKAIEDFTAGKVQLLVATDIAARGLHIPDVSVVFSLCVTDEPMDYLHRAGRTGRGEAEGISILVVTDRELPMVLRYQRAFRLDMAEIALHEGKIIEKKPKKTV